MIPTRMLPKGPQAFACPRCRRPFQLTVRNSITEAMKAVGWKLSGDQIVCPHCTKTPACVGEHNYEQKEVPWYRPQTFRTFVCTHCGQLTAETRGNAA